MGRALGLYLLRLKKVWMFKWEKEDFMSLVLFETEGTRDVLVAEKKTLRVLDNSIQAFGGKGVSFVSLDPRGQKLAARGGTGKVVNLGLIR